MTVQRPAHGLHVREKLLRCGTQSLSDTELLAVFISSGGAKRSCMQLAHDLMKHLGDMRAVLNSDLQTFQQVPGLGLVRYVQLQAAKELCRRSDFICLQRETQLHNSQQTYAFLNYEIKKMKCLPPCS